MFYCIVIWTFLLIVCCTVGLGVLNLLQVNAFSRLGDRFIVAVWLGMIGLAVILLWVALVLPLAGVGLAVMVGLVGLAFLLPSVRSDWAQFRAGLGRQQLALYLISATGVAVVSTGTVTWLDTGLYHYGIIQWLNQHGSVPGLALLFTNLGFSSSWFAFAAPINPVVLGSRGSTVTDGFVLLLAIMQTFICFGAVMGNRAQFSDWFLGLFSLVLLVFTFGSPHLTEVAISASPDLPIAFLTGVVPWTMLVVANAAPALAARPSKFSSALVPLMLAAGAFTIKLIALPLLFVSCLFYLVHNRRSLQRLMDGFAALILLISPFLITQVLTSGCPLFPSSLWCLETPFAVPPETSQSIAEETHDWTSWYGASSATGIGYVWERFLSWFNDHRANQLMALLAVFSLVAVGFLVKWLRHSAVRGYGWVIAIQIVGIIFYLRTSPLLRFALPCLLLIPALLGASYGSLKLGASLSKLLPKLLNWPNGQGGARKLDVLLLPAAFLAAFFVITVSASSPTRLLLPPPLRSVSLVQKQVNNITYLSPEGEEVCWGTTLPCAFEVTPDVELREPEQGVAAGFIRRMN
jgi:hypothetical protein